MKEESPRTYKLDKFDYFFCIYVLVSSLIGRFSYAYPIVAALAVTPNLFLLPYLVGSAIISFSSRTLGNTSKSLKFLGGFLLGSLFLYCPPVLTSLFRYNFNMAVFDIVIVGIISCDFLIDGLRRIGKGNIRSSFPKGLPFERTKLLVTLETLAVIGIAIFAFYIPKIKVPFPLISYDHAVGQETIQPVTRLLDQGFLDVSLARAEPVIIQAVVSSLSGVPVYNLSWAAPLSTSLVFCLAMFSLTYSITKKRALAVASVLFAIFLFSGGTDLFFDCVYYIFRYSTIQTAVFPLVLQAAYVHFSKIKDEEHKARPLMFLAVGTALFIGTLYFFVFLQPSFLTSVFPANEYLRPPLIFIFLTVVLICSTKIKNQALKELIFFVSLFAAFSVSLDIFRPVLDVGFVFFLLLLLGLTNTKVARSFQFTVAGIKTHINALWSRQVILLRVVAFVMLLWIIICMTGFVNIMDFSPIVGPWGLDTLIKLQSLIAANSVVVAVIFLAVSIPLLFSKSPGEFALAFLSIVGVSAFFFPLSELFYISYNISNITIGFTIVVGLFKIVDYLSHSIRIPKLKLKVSNLHPKTVLCLSLCAILVIPVIEASVTRFTWTGGADYRSILTDYEEKAIEYVSKLPETVRIISDPFTMIAFSSLTNRVGLVEHGIAPLTEQYPSANTVSTIWNDVFHGDSSQGIQRSIMGLQNVIPPDEDLYVQRENLDLNQSTFIVIVSARTAWWLDNDDPLGYYTIFPWSYTVDLSNIIRFLDTSTFDLVYSIPNDIYMFMVQKDGNSTYRVDTNYLFQEPQTTFWNVNYYGVGNLSIVLSQTNSSVDQTELNNCLNVTPISGNYSMWGLSHTFGNLRDMSGYQLVTLPFYGQDNNSTFYFSLDGPTVYDRTIFLFKDDFVGWNSIFFQLDKPTTTEGEPNLANVIRITFSPWGTSGNYDCNLLLGPISATAIDYYP